ncbi:MAG: hypothetical protein DHS20C18_23890 [Saprospiraceae bacterium]|nr:MAG: hypothetical protein DHS20C18_23890 [Saprospiraceae bacterium]
MIVEPSTEQIIKEAAKKIFVRKGFAGARMQEIAEEAGINKALLHYYYRSKEKLFEGIFSEIFDHMIGQLKQSVTTDKPLIQKIEDFVDRYISTIEQNPYIPLFIVNEIAQNPDRFVEKIKSKQVFPELAGFFQQMLGEMERGNIREIPPLHLFLNILGLCAFPFIAKPMVKAVSGMDEDTWEMLMKDRKKEVKTFIRRALMA